MAAWAKYRLATLGLVAVCASAQPATTWRLAKSEHFEVYSQAGDDPARSALIWFERLRAFFLQQTWLTLDHLPPVRVIGFRSAKEYEPYRLRATADAYFVGTESRDYIVMPRLDAGQFNVAAHEYTHLILHATGAELPSWLGEGLAELYSTLDLSESGSSLGSDLPAHSQLLRRRSWIPLSQLLELTPDSPLREDRDSATLFYSQSWALTEMLVLSPEYGSRFPALVTSLTSGTPGARALTSVYERSLDAIERDVRAWAGRNRAKPAPLSGVVTVGVLMDFSDVSPFASRTLLAELLLTAGELDRAEAFYRDLAREAPEAADVSAALGMIAFRRGDSESARREWKRAIDHGISDATLCYRYATLAQDAGVPADEIRPALERAIALRPGFDDARYQLALLEKNAGRYDAAVTHLRAIRNVPPARAYVYWITVADALNELGRREEAKTAAQAAAERATTPDERSHAAQLVYLTQTDLAVQFTRDASGQPQMVTTRAPHNSPDWNSFIEPGDDMRRIQGTLRKIDCSDAVTLFFVDAGGKRVILSIPDPSRVLMRNAPAEFTCGPQRASTVTVDYAISKTQGSKAEGIVRGMEFRK